MGDISAGLMLRFKDEDYLRPPVNIYYSFRPLRLPKSWGNEGKGGVDLESTQRGRVLVRQKVPTPYVVTGFTTLELIVDHASQVLRSVAEESAQPPQGEQTQ